MNFFKLFVLPVFFALLVPLGVGASESGATRGLSTKPTGIIPGDISQKKNSAYQLAQAGPTRKPPAASQNHLALGLREFVKLVKEKNERIIFQQLEWAVRQEAIKGERAIFEPVFVGIAQHEKNRKRNTVEEIISRSSSIFGGGDPTVFLERNNDYDASVEALLLLGTRLRLGYNLRDISNSLSAPVAPDLSQYQTFIGASIEQPLLKNGGTGAVMAGIRIAEAEADVAFQAYRQEMMGAVFEAASAYWDLYLAQERYSVRGNSVRIAEQLLKNNREWVQVGRMAETEVLEAEAGLALRKSLRRAAEQDVTAAMNDVRSFFSSSVADEQTEVRATDRATVKEADAEFGRSLEKAFKLRPEYISGLRKTEREGIRIAFAKNQRWPQLNLKASYGLNGLDTSVEESFKDARDRDFESWSVGLELRIPLTGDKKSRSELEVARKRKKQVLLEVKAVETALANSTDTAVKNLYSAREQALYYEDAVRLRQRLMDVEVARFEAGRSDSRLLLEREGDLLQAKEAELEGLVNYQKAELGLERQEGSLLLNFGIEEMEVDK